MKLEELESQTKYILIGPNNKLGSIESSTSLKSYPEGPYVFYAEMDNLFSFHYCFHLTKKQINNSLYKVTKLWEVLYES